MNNIAVVKKEKFLIVSLISIFFILFLVSLLVGAYHLSFSQICGIISGKYALSTQSSVFLRLRLPRTLTAAAAGAALAVTGAVYQTIFRSVLASPDLTGVASGASLGTAFAIVFCGGSQIVRIGFSFAFGLASLFFMLLIVGFAGTERNGTYILAGVIISSIADALMMFIKIAADPEGELSAIEFFTMGSLGSVMTEKMLYMYIFAMPALVLLLIFRRETVILFAGSEHARGLGLSPSLWRWVLLSLSTLAVAAVVSVTGVVSFIGLTAPHIVLMLYKRRSGAYFLLCALAGACFLMAADILARSISPGAELPLSIFTVIFSSPVLFVLLRRRKRGAI